MAPIRRVKTLIALVVFAAIVWLVLPSKPSHQISSKSPAGTNRLRHANKEFDPLEFEKAADRLAHPGEMYLHDLVEVDPEDPFDAAVAWHNILNARPFSPIVIVSKSFCPHSARAKKILLEKYDIKPAPRVIELDQHPHGAELQAHIHTVSGRRTVPNIFVLHKTRGGGDDMAHLDLSGELEKKLTHWAKDTLTIKKRV